MQPCNGMYIRPLLWASREQIKKFAIENGIQWREDSTNQDTVFLRNKIRHNLMPVYDGIKSDAREKILQSVECLASENQLYRELLKDKLSAIETVDGVLHSVEKRHFGLQLLFEWIRGFGFSYSQCESIYASLDGEPGREFYSNEYQLVVEKETVELFPIDIEKLAEKELSFSEFEISPSFKLQTSNPDVAQLDFDKIKLPLKMRSWQQGDRFRPLGMRGSKLVSDFFNDLNFTAYRKKTAQILTDADDNIVWIVGYRIDDRYKITEKTKTIYQIEVK